MRPTLWLAATSLLAAPVSGQMASPAARAAETITAEDVGRHISVIAHDSMMGRDTPSKGLEQTAQYIADQFQRFGLKPGGEKGTWFQRYAITRRRLDLPASRVVFAAGGREATATFATAARHERGPVPDQPIDGSGVLIGGTHAVSSIAQLDLRDKIVLYVPNAANDERTQLLLVRALYLAGPRAVVVLSAQDSASFAAYLPQRSQERLAIGTPSRVPVVIQVRAGAVQEALRAGGVDVAQLRSASTPVHRALPELTVGVRMKDVVTSSLTAPNTVGIVEGTDPTLKHEYIVYSAHMDHIGVTPGQPDSINNGADDDASGTVGLIELAEAFSRPGAQPRRSQIFLAVSGEEKGLWGSAYFSDHPTVPAKQLVANFNLDMIGRNWPDTIVAIGKEHSDLGATLERVNAAHPELKMVAIDDRWPEERFYFRSDHYNFARIGVPVLFFFSGVHEDYHRPSDSPDKINSEKEARILRLVYYVGQEVGNASARPQWNPASYREIVQQEMPR